MLISVQDIQQARRLAQETGQGWLARLQELLGLAPDAFVGALSVTVGYRGFSMRDLHAVTPAFDVITFSETMQRQCLPVRDSDGRLWVIVADPFQTVLQAWIQERVPQAFAWGVAHPDDMTAFLAAYEETQRAMDSVLSGGGGEGSADLDLVDISLKSISQDTSPVVKLVNSTLYDALKTQVSDIHLETSPGGLSIKYRIDGVLSLVGNVAGLDMAEQVVSRLKVMSELDISERRVPQDGRFKVLVNQREIDFRVSIIPSLFGEDAVLRILDKKSLAQEARGLSLDILGLDDMACTLVRRLSNEPYGMVLVTGPTGSGKTTTLYAAVTEVNRGQDKIITIEDPVEYQLPGVLQIPVNEKKGLTFARGLRAILRHDPDKIMVGEIRDPETAQIAVQAALTGHLVFTTVHANSVFDVIGRFMHMGVDPYSFVAALNGILAQRLLRLSCTHCLEPYTPDAELLALSGLTAEQAKGFVFQQGKGCGHCRGSGYKGRRPIAEVLRLSDELRELILSKAPVSKLKASARAHGMRSLREVAVDCVRRGDTTLQEINRVTFVE